MEINFFKKKESEPLIFPVIYRARFLYNFALFFSGLFFLFLFMACLSENAPSDLIVKVCLSIFPLMACYFLTACFYRILNPVVITLHENGIELNYAGLVPWKNIKKINLFIPQLITFEFSGEPFKVPFYFPFLRRIYHKKETTIKLGFSLKGLNASPDKIKGDIAKVYTLYFIKKNGVDQNEARKLDETDPEKAQALLRELRSILFEKK